MSWVIYIFGSGAAFFSGVGFLGAAVAVFSLHRRDWVARAASLLALFGLILIGLSATPLPYWFYALAGSVSLLWLSAERIERKPLSKYRPWLRIAVLALWLAGTVAEIPYHITPTLQAAGRPTLHVFADSVTAGMDEAKLETWPQLLARSQAIEIQDHSHVGAKVRSMVRKAEGLSLGDGLVLLEIGGNDLLGSTSAKDFERDLEELLTKICGQGRTVVLLELPLPPFANEYGRIQRRLAAKHGVQLIPKRLFVNVLTADGATVDSVHLTRHGHELMAATVWELIQPVYAPQR